MQMQSAIDRPSAQAEGKDQVSGAGNAVVLGTTIWRQLANGMGVLVIPDHRSPIVTHMVWYSNGALDDPEGTSGIAHFLEHLMFKGTEKFPPGAFSRWLQSIGGQENAMTSWSYTCYYQRVAKAYLANCMAYEADRMTNLILTDEIVAVERDVVLAERGMVIESSPDRMLIETLFGVLYRDFPAVRPVIGYRNEIEGLSQQDALDYYSRFYCPENATLVIAGDVDPDQAVAMAEEIYGQLPRKGKLPERIRPRLPVLSERIRQSLSHPAVVQPKLMRINRVPSHASGGGRVAASLYVLQYLIGNGHSSRPYRDLVAGGGKIVSLYAEYLRDAFATDTPFMLSIVPTPGLSLDQAESAYEAALERLAREGFDPADVARAKTLAVAEQVFHRDSHTELASSFGASICCGVSRETSGCWEQDLRSVDAEDLMHALKLISGDSVVIGHLLPAAKNAN